MAKEFTWHASAGLLVDDGVSEWDIKSANPLEAWEKAYGYAYKSNVLDSGTLEIYMDCKELAKELGNIAADDDEDYWNPIMLTEELEKVKEMGLYDLYSTLEEIVCK